LSPRDPFSALFTGIAYAQFVGRNYAEAMRLAREAIRERTDFVGAHRVLTAAAGMAGDTEAAATALQELRRRAQPNISLAWIANEMPDHARLRTGALLGSVPPDGVGLESGSGANQTHVRVGSPSDSPNPAEGVGYPSLSRPRIQGA
jgi:hypothetical protein